MQNPLCHSMIDTMKMTNPRRIAFLLFFLALFLLVARLLYPFITVLLWSGLLYVFLEPLHLRIAGKVPSSTPKGKRPLRARASALFLSIFGILIILVPIAFLSFAVIRQLIDLLKNAVHFFEANIHALRIDPNTPFGSALQSFLGESFDLSRFNPLKDLQSFLASSANHLLSLSGTLLRNVAKFVIAIMFMMFTLYYLLMDGKTLGETIVSMMPTDPAYTRLFLRKLGETGRQLVKGYFLVAGFQGFMMFILCLIFGFKNSLVLAVLTAIASFVPMVGTALIWFPMGLYMATTGSILRAIVFLFAAGLLVSTLDNFVRPVVLGEQLKVHPLFLFFSIVGGLTVFGFNGLILGPLVLMLFIAAGELYQSLSEEHEQEPR